MTIEMIKNVTAILELCITVFGFVFALYLYLKDRRDKTMRNWAHQIIAYNIEEAEAVKWISELMKDDRTRNIQTELRNRAQNSPDNVEKTRPTFNESQVNLHLK